MLTPRQKYEVAKVKIGIVEWAVDTALGATYQALTISTKYGDSAIDWGDGYDLGKSNTKYYDFTTGLIYNQYQHSYSSPFVGNVKIKIFNGIQDVYSVLIGQNEFYLNTSFGNFIKQFTNLYSLRIDQANGGHIGSYINGDISDIPASLEKLSITKLKNSGNLTLNLSNFNTASRLKSLLITGTFSEDQQLGIIIGDLAKIPSGIISFNITYAKIGSTINYTSGRVWSNAFETLQIPIKLTYEEINNLLYDLRMSVTTPVDNKIIYVMGGRTSVSDADVSYLQGLGYTVNIIKQLGNTIVDSSVIIKAGFHNNFDVYTKDKYLGLMPSAVNNPPTFELSGRKPGEYCAVFNGSQHVKTTYPISINSDKITIAFSAKFTQTNYHHLVQKNINSWNTGSTFLIVPYYSAGMILLIDSHNNNRVDNLVSIPALNTWNRYVFTIDRTEHTMKIYINGILKNSVTTPNSGLFTNDEIIIGQIVGSLMDFEMTNTSWSQVKVTEDYNAFL